MTTLCEACESGPVHIGGHDGMRARSLSENGMSFACSRCAALWTRSYSSIGEYLWKPASVLARDGRMSLPPNTAVAASPLAPGKGAANVADHWLAAQLSWKRPRRKPS